MISNAQIEEDISALSKFKTDQNSIIAYQYLRDLFKEKLTIDVAIKVSQNVELFLIFYKKFNSNSSEIFIDIGDAKAKYGTTSKTCGIIFYEYKLGLYFNANMGRCDEYFIDSNYQCEIAILHHRGKFPFMYRTKNGTLHVLEEQMEGIQQYHERYCKFINETDPNDKLGIQMVNTPNGIIYIHISRNDLNTIITSVPPYTLGRTINVDIKDPTNLITEPFDASPFAGKWCVYALQMNEPFIDCIKFGITGNLERRLRQHTAKIKYLKVLKVFVMMNEKSMREAEKAFKYYATSNGTLVTRLTYTEVVQTKNMDQELQKLELLTSQMNEYYKNYDNDAEFDLDDDSDADIDPKIIAESWMTANPPKDKESKTDYYDRYKNNNINMEILTNSVFAKLVIKTIKCDGAKVDGIQCWINK